MARIIVTAQVLVRGFPFPQSGTLRYIEPAAALSRIRSKHDACSAGSRLVGPHYLDYLYDPRGVGGAAFRQTPANGASQHVYPSGQFAQAAARIGARA
jgi:hypothetical protein